MARKPTGNPNGRPRKKIDRTEFEKLCEIQCTEEEICAVFSCDETTLIKWCKETYGETFSKVFAEKRIGGKTSLRRAQWKLAETNATMGIWLGKQYLGQRDNIDINQSIETKPLTIELNYEDCSERKKES